MKFALCIISLLGLTLTQAHADEPIGGKYFSSENFTTTATIISAANNVNGAHLRSVVMLGNAYLAFVPPLGSGGTTRVMLGGATGAPPAHLPYPMYLPTGWSVTAVPNSGSANVYATYDLNGAIN